MAADKKSKGTKKSKPKGNATGTRKKASDPRFRIISGVFLMLVSLFIVISTISYLIGYNLTGNWGETIGEWCSRNTFGIGTFYLLFLLFISGSMLTFKGPKIKIITICKYCLVFLIWTPLFLATILPNNEVCETIYGLVGTKIYLMLEPYISEIGIYIVLFFAAFLYVVFTFDIKMPTFNFNADKKNKDDEETDDYEDNTEDDSEDEKPITIITKDEDDEEDNEDDDINHTEDFEDEDEDED
ncbi:MAG: hypothetical protein II981_03310, partial [Bacteroidales bacterium]|nr:hypothetical protein [Bacteroidales bacterium]